ncbi:SRPBCC family protein [Pelagibacterium montanilacus]|uniref:SRPBCC family protein n=1 Tax=Pelagibacterium montanilacus TaxID=2185280 RepID=UPI000F8EC191|nr:SRPBCC family protein [Pelagibacterium montanilacus]
MPAIKQVFTVNHPRDVVWDKFQDIDAVVECLPGASLTGPVVDGKAKGRVTVKLGPVKADFGGEAEITTDEATHTGKIAGVGIDKNHSSRAKGTATYTLEDAPNGGTVVTVDVEYSLSGSLAQFARGGIVDAVAEQICQDFAANLEAELSADTSEPARAAPGSAPVEGEGVSPIAHEATTQPAPAVAPKRKQTELNAFGLLWTVFKKRIARLFGRG